MNWIASTVLAAATLVPALAGGNKDLAIQLMNSGKGAEAIAEFSKLAQDGDTLAMVTIGNLYYEGKGVAQDYGLARKWYNDAYLRNADALCNLGVLYRDGKGVAPNPQIAYCIFITIHMKGLGSEATQIRNGSNLRKTLALLTPDQAKTALCRSEEYLADFLKADGHLAQDYQQTGVPLKDKKWWRPGELPSYDCPCQNPASPVAKPS